MALAPDAFGLVVKEISDIFTTFRDGFALFGALCASRKALSVTYNVYYAIKVHGLARAIQPNFVKKYGPWAVVTGSTSGIGKAYAQELASCGVNIVLISLGKQDCEQCAQYIGCTDGIGANYVELLAKHGLNTVLISRTESKLSAFAKRLEETFAVETHIIPVDFNDGKPVYDLIKQELEGKEIGILVNNVGVNYDYPQYFLDVPEEKLWQLVHVNVAAATMMTHMVLPQMVQRGRGAIVTVASGACQLPTPQMSVYSATKTYLDYFSRALKYEYGGKGITFQCLMPCFVATRMTQYSSTLSNTGLLVPSAAAYARQALYTLGWSARTAGYWPHAIQSWIYGQLPEWLWLWASTRLNNAFRRQAMQRARRKSRQRVPSQSALGQGEPLKR